MYFSTTSPTVAASRRLHRVFRPCYSFSLLTPPLAGTTGPSPTATGLGEARRASRLRGSSPAQQAACSARRGSRRSVLACKERRAVAAHFLHEVYFQNPARTKRAAQGWWSSSTSPHSQPPGPHRRKTAAALPTIILFPAEKKKGETPKPLHAGRPTYVPPTELLHGHLPERRGKTEQS